MKSVSMKAARKALLILGSTLLITASWAAEENPADYPATAEALQQRLQTVMGERHIPGSSYAVFDAQGMRFGGQLGQAQLDGQHPVKADTLFRAGSITKTLTAIAIMQLVEQGRFTLDTEVHELLPDAPIVNPYDVESPVRVVHLLEHTAGFDDMHFKGFFAAKEQPGTLFDALLTDPEPLRVRWRPGTMMAYSNSGYAVLGAILERQLGQNWEQIIAERVLQPLQMTHSLLSNADAMQRDHADGYTDDAMNPTPTLPILPRSAGSLWSTAEDLTQLGRFLLTDGASHPGILRRESVQEMKRVHSTLAAKAGLQWGYGLAVAQEARSGLRWIGHDGGVNGFFSFMYYNPESGLGYVELHNSDNSGGRMIRPLTGYIAKQQEVAKNPAAATTALPADIEGWYRLANSRNELFRGFEWLLGVIHAAPNGSELDMNPVLGTPVHLRAIGSNVLQNRDNGFYDTAAIRDASGAVTGIDTNSQFAERTSAFAALAPIALAGIAALALVTAPFGRRRALRSVWTRRWLLLSVLSLATAIACIMQLDIVRAADIYWVSLGVFAGSLLFPIASFAALWNSLRNWSAETARLARGRALAGAIGGVALGLYFAVFHWFALALWAW